MPWECLIPRRQRKCSKSPYSKPNDVEVYGFRPEERRKRRNGRRRGRKRRRRGGGRGRSRRERRRRRTGRRKIRG